MARMSLPDGRIPVVLSAHAEDLLASDAAAILRYLERGPRVEDVAATLLGTRRLRRHRAVVRAADVDELAAGLTAVAAGDEHPLVSTSSEGTAPALAFVFPGQGSQWPGMGAELYRALDVYRSEADRCAAAFHAATAPSPLDYLLGSAEGRDFAQTEIQGAQFTHAVALAKVWQSCGVQPDFTMGHSLGEVGACHLSGLIEVSDAAAIVAARATTVELLQGSYGMAVLGLTVEQTEELIAEQSGWLELSVVNSDSSVVVSGERDAVAALTRLVDGRGQFAREISVAFPAHTSALEPLRSEFANRLPPAQFRSSTTPFVGSATAESLTVATDYTDYWYHNLRNTVRFDRAAHGAIRRGARAFAEMSAHPALLFALGDIADELLPDGAAVLTGSGRRDESALDELSAGITAVAAADPAYRWSDLVPSTGAPLPDFPNAPMSATHLWATPEPLPPLQSDVTVTAEEWIAEPLPALRVPASRRRVAVLDLGAGDAMADQLRRALDRSLAADYAEADAADALVVIAPAVDGTDAADAADELAALVGDGLLGYGRAIGPLCRDVWLVTAAGEHVGDSAVPADAELAVAPGQAALAAMHRCVGFEFPDQTFRHLDLPSRTVDAQLADVAVDVVLTEHGEVALRRNPVGLGLWKRVLGGQIPVAEPLRFDDGLLDNVVITGGTGVIGLQFARALAQRGARRILLLSRRAVAPAVLGDPGEGTSAEIRWVKCDLTDPVAVQAAAAEFGGASLVIHAAGTADFATNDVVTAPHFRYLTSAKIAGLANLAEHWPMAPATRILLCSSVIGVWGGKGSIAYAAANRMLDVMATQLRARGLAALSIRWGLWAGSSIVDAAETERVQRSGLRPMDPGPAIEAGLRGYVVDPLVLSADADRLAVFFGAQASDEQAAERSTDINAVPAAIRDELAAVLDADPSLLDLNMSLFDLGIDSLLALDLRKRIKRVTGQSVPLATLLGGVTGSQLIATIDGGADEQKKVDVSS